MSDVIWAASIAGGVSVVGNFVTLGVAHVTTRTDAARLAEESRRTRREAYHALLVHLEQLDTMTSGYTDPPAPDQFADWLGGFRERQAAVRLLESPAILKARKEFGKLLDELSERMQEMDPNASFEDRLGVPYVEMRPRFNDAGRALSDAMRQDLGLSSK